MSDTSSTAALSVRGLVKSYGSTRALSGVSLEVDGQIFGLLGANGAGKSTLIKAVLGLVRPDEGEVLVGGVDSRREPLAVRRRIGYLPEELNLYDRLTGWELLELAGGLKGLDFAAQAEEDLRYFGMWERRDELMGGYSLGMTKKIGIVAALLGEPELMLLDEPLNGLDAESMRALRLRLEDLEERGRTIILSSHVMAFVERVCRRVCVLKKGEIVALGTPEELRAKAEMPEEPFDDVFLNFAL